MAGNLILVLILMASLCRGSGFGMTLTACTPDLLIIHMATMAVIKDIYFRFLNN